MFNKEEEKKVISMDMGGEIKPVELPKEEEKAEIKEEKRSTVIPQLMQIGPEIKEEEETNKEVPLKVEEKPKPKPVPTIGEVKRVEAKPVVEEKKEEAKVEEKPAIKITSTPKVTPTITITPKPPIVTSTPVVSTPKPTVVVPTPQVIKPTPTINAPKPNVTPVPKEEPDIEKTMVLTDIKDVKNEAPLEISDVKVEKEEVKEEPKEEKVEAGPNVISEPLATEDNKKEKKKNPHFLECPPDCKPISPFGYIGLTILYNIPIIGLIMILAHSASYKNLNRRNYARSYLIIIVLIILLIAAAIYFLKIDVLKIIEDVTGYKIDLQHFKFTKFK